MFVIGDGGFNFYRDTGHGDLSGAANCGHTLEPVTRAEAVEFAYPTG